MLFWTTVLTACLLFAGVRSDEKKLALKIVKHQPCTTGSPQERIRFPSNQDAPLQDDKEKGDGCYALKGKVSVLKDITGSVQMLTVMQYGTNAEVEQCHGADDNGCGGVGSCVYCDACKQMKELSTSAVQLEVGNKPIDCKAGLKAKQYDNIKVSFCMPYKSEFLAAYNMEEDFFDKYVKNRLFFMTIYVFNKEINSLPRDKVFAMAKPDHPQVIGCHKLVGRLYD